MADLVIRGALIVDGTGDEPRTADVAVTDEPPAPSKTRAKDKEREAQPAPAS